MDHVLKQILRIQRMPNQCGCIC